MNDWSAGYVADIGYTYGYYGELNPLRSVLALLSNGLAAPSISTGCELGYGQGLSINIHAATSAVEWHGTDFNPAQAGFGQELARHSGAAVHLRDDAFADFVNRNDLPDFDFIGLHGIWSWVSDQNRAYIVDFIRRKLRVGGVLYISYNTLPGWAAFAPMRHLMTEHAEIIGAAGRGIVSRIDDAIDFADRLLQTNPVFLRANPLVGERIKKLKEQNRHYLAHEYFNKDWHPMHFATLAEWLAPAKLQYACSANFMDFVDVLNLSAEQLAFLKEIPDRMFRESVRDFMVNQQFRRDYWVKGARPLNPLEQMEALRQQHVILVSPRPDIVLKVNGMLGEANLSEAVYKPILDLLADHKPRSIGAIADALASQVNFAALHQAVMILIGAGHLHPAQSDQAIRKAKDASDRLNALIASKSRSNTDLAYLASPVTGAGHMLNRFQQLFLLAMIEGKRQPQEMAAYVWRLLEVMGQKLILEGNEVETPEENLQELAKQAAVFLNKSVPLLKALKICP